jgi:hypothetical protein
MALRFCESVSCNSDNTVCNINISASITIYAAKDSGLTQNQLNDAAATIKSSIEEAWKGTFVKDGVSYNVKTQVSISVAASQADAMQSGAQNAIGISSGDAMPGYANSYVEDRTPGRALTGEGPDTGTWNIQHLSLGDAAHEFTQLVGVRD